MAFAPAVPIVIFVWFCVESSRWLMREQQYLKACCRIRKSEVLPSREFYYAHCQIVEKRITFAGITLSRRVLDLQMVARLRRATIARAIVVIALQFSRINIVALYISTIFSEVRYGIRDCLLVSMGLHSSS